MALTYVGFCGLLVPTNFLVIFFSLIRISDPETEVDPQFRMWLSSKPDLSFPVSILQVGHKVSGELGGTLGGALDGTWWVHMGTKILSFTLQEGLY